MADLIEPKEIEIVDPQGGKTRKFIISKIPAWDAREIVFQYPLTALPKVGDYAAHSQTVLKLLSFAGVTIKEGLVQRLSTVELINNHCPNWEVELLLEKEMMNYNSSFFFSGRLQDFSRAFLAFLSPWIASTATTFFVQLSQVAKQASSNSKQDTA